MGMGRGRAGMWDKLDLLTCFENACWLACLFCLANAHLAVIWWHFHSCNMLCSCTSDRNRLCPAGGSLETTISRLHLCHVHSWALLHRLKAEKETSRFSPPSIPVSINQCIYESTEQGSWWLNGHRPKWHLIPSGTAQCVFGITDVGGGFSMDRQC